MTWFYLCVLTAVIQGLKDLVIRRSAGGDPAILAWGFSLCTTLGLVPALLIAGPGEIRPGFWPPLFMSGLILCWCNVLYFKALHASDLSLTSPMLAFTPLFLLVTAPIMVGEFPGPGGLLGMLLIVAGSYLLRIHFWRGGALAPARALMREPGPRIMLLVAFLWSITANFDKIGVEASSPILWSLAVNLAVTIGLTPLALSRLRRHALSGALGRNLRTMVLTGAAEALSMVLQMAAITMTIVPYVISVKRASVVVGVILGWLVLGEKGVRERLAGALLMVAGVACIALL